MSPSKEVNDAVGEAGPSIEQQIAELDADIARPAREQEAKLAKRAALVAEQSARKDAGGAKAATDYMLKIVQGRSDTYARRRKSALTALRAAFEELKLLNGEYRAEVSVRTTIDVLTHRYANAKRPALQPLPTAPNSDPDFIEAAGALRGLEFADAAGSAVRPCTEEDEHGLRPIRSYAEIKTTDPEGYAIAVQNGLLPRVPRTAKEERAVAQRAREQEAWARQLGEIGDGANIALSEAAILNPNKPPRAARPATQQPLGLDE